MSIREEADDSLLAKRIQILESNVGRVYHQHQTLKPLVIHSSQFNPISKLVHNIENTKSKAQTLKSNVQNIYQQLIDTRQTQCQISAQMRLKYFTKEVHSIKEQIKNLNSAMELPPKQQITKIKHQLAIMNTKTIQKIQNSKKDVQYLLEDIANKEKSYVNAHFQQISNEIFNQHSKQLQNLRRELGLLQCEIMYLKDKSNKQTITQQNNINKERDENIRNAKLANLQQSNLKIELNSFVNENSQRISFQTNLLKTKIEQLYQSYRNKKITPLLSNQISYIQQQSRSLNYQKNGLLKFINSQLSKINYRKVCVSHEEISTDKFQKMKHQLKILQQSLDKFKSKMN